jgi:ribosome-associated heat shock protein Hsp15
VTRETQRVDVLLHRLRLMRSRSEAKAACEAGAVRVSGATARASSTVASGDLVEVDFPGRRLEIEVITLPAKSLSRAGAREHFRTLTDEPSDG